MTATMPGLSLFVAGKPAPQGSKHARPIYKGKGDAKVFTGKVAQVESSKAGVNDWRADVRAELLTDGTPIRHFPQGTAVIVRLAFVMPRPAGMPKTRATPPHTKRPDVDKLQRAVLDAVGSAGVWHDDCQVVDVHATKRTAELGETSGCWIEIEELAS